MDSGGIGNYIKNALVWGLFKEHYKKANFTSLKGIGHVVAAALEFFPVVSQIFSTIEYLGRLAFFPPEKRTDKQKKVDEIAQRKFPMQKDKTGTTPASLSPTPTKAADKARTEAIPPTTKQVAVTTVRLKPEIQHALHAEISAFGNKEKLPEQAHHLWMPFHTFSIPQSGSIYLGNDSVRTALTKKPTDHLKTINGTVDQYTGLADSCGIREICPKMKNVPKLIVSFNGNVTKDPETGQETGLKKFSPLTLPEGEHMQCPLSENDPDAFSKAINSTELANIFLKMDDMLNKGEDLLLHCNQGEHRSAAMFVLYLAVRGETSFEDAWKYVQSKRTPIKPLHEQQTGRLNIMLETYAWYKKNCTKN